PRCLPPTPGSKGGTRQIASPCQLSCGRECEYGAGVAGGSSGRERTCGELDDERGRARQAVVFPADDATGFARQPPQRQADECGEAPLDRDAAGALVAVDAPDDEELLTAVRVAEFGCVDAATLDRAADQDATRVRACGQGEQKRGECRGAGVHDRLASSAAAEQRLNGSGGRQRDEEAAAVVACFDGDLAGGAVRETAGERESEPGSAGAVARVSGHPADPGLEDRLPFVGA